MGWYRALDRDVIGTRKSEALSEAGNDIQGAFTLRPACRITRSLVNRDARGWTVDGKADTAVGSPQLAVQVEETEVQAGWSSYAQGRGLGQVGHREILVVVGAAVHKVHRTIP